jgi:hypothetical protein
MKEEEEIKLYPQTILLAREDYSWSCRLTGKLARKCQTIGTLMNEEAFLLVQYLRGENQTWSPRIAF